MNRFSSLRNLKPAQLLGSVISSPVRHEHIVPAVSHIWFMMSVMSISSDVNLCISFLSERGAATPPAKSTCTFYGGRFPPKWQSLFLWSVPSLVRCFNQSAPVSNEQREGSEVSSRGFKYKTAAFSQFKETRIFCFVPDTSGNAAVLD